MSTIPITYFQGVPIIFERTVFSFLTDNNYSSIIVLTDKNVEQHCLETFKEITGLTDFHLISLTSGEKAKTLQSVDQILNSLISINADRNCLLINLGGGMITDLGGFCASIYKRGINYINVPTSLLGMTDASIGGKTGVDHEFVKNVAGTYYLPQGVLIYTGFLDTLPHEEFINGLAEVYKHAIIDDADLWEGLQFYEFGSNDLPLELLMKSIQVKTKIVDLDYLEKNDRKKLNFGHTIGHSLEALYLENGKELSHGQAVAAGMWMESWLNMHQGDLSEENFSQISEVIEKFFTKISFEESDFEKLLEYINNDKKTTNKQILITKIQSIGFSFPDFKVSPEDVKKAFEAYIKNLNHLKTF